MYETLAEFYGYETDTKLVKAFILINHLTILFLMLDIDF